MPERSSGKGEKRGHCEEPSLDCDQEGIWPLCIEEGKTSYFTDQRGLVLRDYRVAETGEWWATVHCDYKSDDVECSR